MVKLGNREYDYLKVYRKVYGVWIKKDTIYKNPGQDGNELFLRTRDHYKQLWYDNQAPNEKYLKIELCWKPEEYEF